jgi:hypothetical protein
MSIDEALAAVAKLKAAGAVEINVSSGASGEYRVEARIEAGPQATTLAPGPPLPGDPEERRRELKRRADDLDFHSA